MHRLSGLNRGAVRETHHREVIRRRHSRDDKVDLKVVRQTTPCGLLGAQRISGDDMPGQLRQSWNLVRIAVHLQLSRQQAGILFHGGEQPARPVRCLLRSDSRILAMHAGGRIGDAFGALLGAALRCPVLRSAPLRPTAEQKPHAAAGSERAGPVPACPMPMGSESGDPYPAPSSAASGPACARPSSARCGYWVGSRIGNPV